MAEADEIRALTTEIRQAQQKTARARRAGDADAYVEAARHLAHLRDRRVTLRAAAMRGDV